MARMSTVGLVALAAIVSLIGAEAATAAPEPSRVKVKVWGTQGGDAPILGRVTAAGSLEPWRPDQKVRVFFYRDTKPLFSKLVPVTKGSGDWGTYRVKTTVRRPGRHAVQVRYYGRGGVEPVAPDSTVRKHWGVSFPTLTKGECGPVVEGFRKALNEMAFVPSKSRCYDGKMERAVLAYRKLNQLGRNARAGSRIVKKVYSRTGRYRVRRPELGDHVEAPLSRQVMVFARGKKPYAIFPIASGAPATPTILGTYSFYWKDPGYNALGMYYSSYFIRGYAIHGYKSVPDYPASHGCLRTFIADQPRIYELTKIGQPIHLFGNAFRTWPGDAAARGLPDPARFD